MPRKHSLKSIDCEVGYQDRDDSDGKLTLLRILSGPTLSEHDSESIPPTEGTFTKDCVASINCQDEKMTSKTSLSDINTPSTCDKVESTAPSVHEYEVENWTTAISSEGEVNKIHSLSTDDKVESTGPSAVESEINKSNATHSSSPCDRVQSVHEYEVENWMVATGLKGKTSKINDTTHSPNTCDKVESRTQSIHEYEVENWVTSLGRKDHESRQSRVSASNSTPTSQRVLSIYDHLEDTNREICDSSKASTKLPAHVGEQESFVMNSLSSEIHSNDIDYLEEEEESYELVGDHLYSIIPEKKCSLETMLSELEQECGIATTVPMRRNISYVKNVGRNGTNVSVEKNLAYKMHQQQAVELTQNPSHLGRATTSQRERKIPTQGHQGASVTQHLEQLKQEGQKELDYDYIIT
jgi:hypothetical protein